MASWERCGVAVASKLFDPLSELRRLLHSLKCSGKLERVGS